jgi:Holliday junction resolvase RusA-like endonuclease
MKIEFFVPGIPSTAGSKRAIPIFASVGGARVWKRNVVIDDAKRGKGWRESVQSAAISAMAGGDPVRGIPLYLQVTFTMPRLKSHYRKNGDLKGDAPTWQMVKPDATKLIRAIEDAITGICWHDDAQVALQYAQKVYGSKPGASVVISDQLPF